jgi:CRP-like cAMP-binding protein
VNNGVIDILGSGGVFQQCSARDLKRISLFTDDLSFANKQIVFERGDPSSFLYVLADGLLKLTGSTSGGNEAVLEFVNPTASVCEQTVFTQQPFSVSAQALQPSRVLAVSMRSLLELMHARPPLAWKIAATVSAKVEALTERLLCFASLNAEQRAATLLLEQFADRTSRRGPKQTDMANMLAISPETLCRLLAKFRRSGWIANSDGQVIIVDPKGLHSVLPDTGPPPR